MDLFQAYCAGRELEVWKRLCAKGEKVGSPRHIEPARQVAIEAMKRVRRNIRKLIPRWKKAGHRFGYRWLRRNRPASPEGRKWLAQFIKYATAVPLLGNPTKGDLKSLERFEQTKGPLPIVLRAVYEVIGAVNFVGDIAPGWPDMEILDPLQIRPFAPQMKRLMTGETDQVDFFDDHLIKYDIAGVGPSTVPIHPFVFDPVIHFEGQGLIYHGEPLTIGLYLREVILKRGGIGLVAGWNNDAPDPDLIKSLTKDLVPF